MTDHSPTIQGAELPALSDDELFTVWDEHYADVNSYSRPRLDRDFMRAVIAADRASRAAGQTWQPIEAAPKDGTLILAFRQDWVDCYGIAWWSKGSREWERSGSQFRDASHWMQLPAKPGAAPQSSTLAPEAGRVADDEAVISEFNRRVEQHVLHGGWKCACCGFDGQDNTRANFFCSNCKVHK